MKPMGMKSLYDRCVPYRLMAIGIAACCSSMVAFVGVFGHGMTAGDMIGVPGLEAAVEVEQLRAQHALYASIALQLCAILTLTIGFALRHPERDALAWVAYFLSSLLTCFLAILA